MTAQRYAVLHHTGIGRPHFDLLFEIEAGAAALTSLRCSTWPPSVGDHLDEQPEHRLLYLDYEGVISGDRGSVSRTDAGVVQVSDLAIDPPTLGLRLISSQNAEITDITLVHRFDADHSPKWTVVTHATMQR